MARHGREEDRSVKRIRILLAKPGLDGHEAGAKLIAMGLMNEGMEVIYTGPRQTPEQIANTAIQEDVDVVGLSSLSGAHSFFFPRVVELIREQGGSDILVIGGGIIPKKDIPALQESGVKAVFGPGSSIKQVAKYIRENARSPK